MRRTRSTASSTCSSTATGPSGSARCTRRTATSVSCCRTSSAASASLAHVKLRGGRVRRRILGCPSCRAVPTSTSSARAAAPRCPRTSRSAPTAARGSRSARPSSIAAACPRRPRKARSRPQLPRLRPGEIPGIRADRRAVGGLDARARVGHRHARAQVAACSTTRTSRSSPASTSPWRAFTDPVRLRLDRLRGGRASARSRCSAGCSSAATAGGRRCSSSWSAARAARTSPSIVADEGIARGANGAALGMLAAWTMRDVLGRRKGREDDSDLLGVLAIAAVLVLLPLATTDASGIAGRRRRRRGHPASGCWSGAACAAKRARVAHSEPLEHSPPRSRARRAAGRQRARQRRHGEHDRDDQRERERAGDADDVGALARAHRAPSRARKITSPSGMPIDDRDQPQRRAARVDDARARRAASARRP